jgi:hypothetical protein
MTFIKGQKSWNAGKSNIYSDESLEKMRIAKLNKVSAFKGKRHSEESKLLIRKARALQKVCGSKKGCVSPFKGKKQSIEVIEGMRERAKNQVNKVGPKGPWSLPRRLAYELNKKPRKPIVDGSREYVSNWHEIRKEIYRRDLWKCQSCELLCGRAKGIACHHIDYNTRNNEHNNLITLCTSCHAKTNFKRTEWINYFKNKMQH